MSTTPAADEPQPVYYLNFTSTCQHCGATVRTVDGVTQPHECMPTPDAPQWAATVKPGDTLIVGFAHEFTREQADRAYAQFAKLLPGVKVVIAAGVTSMAVAPAEPSGGAV